MSDSTPLDIASMRYLNESAIQSHALECSKRFRGGKFTRVGSDFIDEVKTDVETIIRELRGKATTMQDPIPVESLPDLTTGNLKTKLGEVFNQLIARTIQNKVQRQPSVGCTLRATR